MSKSKKQSIRITVYLQKNTIFLEGNMDDFVWAEKEVDQLITKVKVHPYTVTKPGMYKFFSKAANQFGLDAIGQKTKCVVEVQQSDRPNKSISTEPYEEVHQVEKNHLSGPRFIAKKANLTKLNVDVVVNAANDELKHIGGLAYALVEAGGRQIQEESNEYLRIHNCTKLEDGEVVPTAGGKLPCKKVYHGVGPMWKLGTDDEEEKLKKVVVLCLRQLLADRLSSIAFPAISSGVFGYPTDQATLAIVQAADQFCTDNVNDVKGIGLTIYFVDSKYKTTKHFQDALNNVFGETVDDELVESTEIKPKALRSSLSEQDPDTYDTDDELEEARRENEEHSSEGAEAAVEAVGYTAKDSDVDFGKGDFKAGSSQQEVVTREGITVKLVKGEIAKEQVDIIVNTCGQQLKLSQGAVSKSLLQAAGSKIQEEISKKYPKGLKPGQIATTMAYNLRSKGVYHGFLPEWSATMDISKNALRELIKTCLTMAHKSRHKPKSVAFPAMGTGQLNYPKDFVARTMYEEVFSFSKQKPMTALQDIHFVVYSKDAATISVFDSQLDELRKGSKLAYSPGKVVSMIRQSRRSNGARSKEDRGKGTKDSSNSIFTNLTMITPGSMQMKIGKIICQVQAGDITQESVDAIVNSSNSNLDLRVGGVSKAIAKTGGPQVVTECQQIGGTKNGIAVTGSGNLPCKMIIHLDVQYFSKDWKKTVYKVLTEAEARTLKTVSFPALGTGAAMSKTASVADIADAMLDGIGSFYAQKDPKHVNLVRITLFPDSLAKDFHRAMKSKEGTPLKDERGLLRKAYDKSKEFFTGEDSFEKKVLTRETKSLLINIYGISQDRITQAEKQIDQLIEQETQKRTISDETVAKLSADQIDLISQMCLSHDVLLDINPDNNMINLEGLKEDVSAVNGDIRCIFQQIAKQELAEAEAEALAKDIQWLHLDGENYSEYPPLVNQVIEKAFQNKKRTCDIIIDSHQYKIKFDFKNSNNSTEEDVRSPSNKVSIKRHDYKSKKNTIALPTNWATMDGSEHVKLVTLDSSSQEYQDVQQKFKLTAGNQITKIDRIQNSKLYKTYMARKEDMDQRNGGKNNELQLFHGTATDSINQINTNGFNRSYCGKNATAYGKGVYFARDASYSVTYASGKQMYLARVLVGDYILGNPSYIVPPTKSGDILYDSVVDNISSPSMYVVFNDTQAYPDYLITFQ